MSTFDLENPNPNPGDSLRDEAANLLSFTFGRPLKETRNKGKKIDLYFSRKDFGKDIRIYVEAKDFANPLSRAQVVSIWADYSGIVERNRPSSLLLITREGLSSDAQSFVVDEQCDMRHQTIWELESNALGLTEYVRYLSDAFETDGLSKYYIPARVRGVYYVKTELDSSAPDILDQIDSRLKASGRTTSLDDIDALDNLINWVNSNEGRPIAILGGYGAGKSSLATRFVASLASRSLDDPMARQPIFIKLGVLSRYSSLELLPFRLDHRRRNLLLRDSSGIRSV